jgi:hypothetical protein
MSEKRPAAQLGDVLLGEEHAIREDHGDGLVLIDERDQLEDVPTKQRLASGEDDVHYAQVLCLADQRLALLRAQLRAAGLAMPGGRAVDTIALAGGGDLHRMGGRERPPRALQVEAAGEHFHHRARGERGLVEGVDELVASSDQRLTLAEH